MRTTWANGFRNTWSDRWSCGHAGERSCLFTFKPQWITSNPRHTVRIRQGSFRGNKTTWDTQDNGGVAVYEGSHMLGLVDEYSYSPCPNRNPVNTGTVMDNNSNDVLSRMMTRLANNVGASVVAS